MNAKIRDMIVTNAVAILAGLLLSGLMLLLLHINPWEVFTYSVTTMLTDNIPQARCSSRQRP